MTIMGTISYELNLITEEYETIMTLNKRCNEFEKIPVENYLGGFIEDGAKAIATWIEIENKFILIAVNYGE